MQKQDQSALHFIWTAQLNREFLMYELLAQRRSLPHSSLPLHMCFISAVLWTVNSKAGCRERKQYPEGSRGGPRMKRRQQCPPIHSRPVRDMAHMPLKRDSGGNPWGKIMGSFLTEWTFNTHVAWPKLIGLLGQVLWNSFKSLKKHKR